jgi:hypothetical protein
MRAAAVHADKTPRIIKRLPTMRAHEIHLPAKPIVTPQDKINDCNRTHHDRRQNDDYEKHAPAWSRWRACNYREQKDKQKKRV